MYEFRNSAGQCSYAFFSQQTRVIFPTTNDLNQELRLNTVQMQEFKKINLYSKGLFKEVYLRL